MPELVISSRDKSLRKFKVMVGGNTRNQLKRKAIGTEVRGNRKHFVYEA